MNDCGAKSKLSAPLIYLSKTGNYSLKGEGVSIKRAYCVIPGYEKLQIKKPRYKDKGEKAVPGSTYPAGVLGSYVLLREDKAGVLT
jgi:hypothetical protein